MYTYTCTDATTGDLVPDTPAIEASTEAIEDRARRYPDEAGKT